MKPFDLNSFVGGQLAYTESGAVMRCVDCDPRRTEKHLLVCVDDDTGYVTFNDSKGQCWRKKDNIWFMIPKFNLVEMV